MKLTRAAVKAKALSEENLALAVQTLRESGYVVLEGVLPARWVQTMRAAIQAALEGHVEQRGTEEMERRQGHVSMLAPAKMPFLDPLAIENPFAHQIMEAVMGPDLYCTFYNTNTAWPGSGIQRIHRDSGHLFSEVAFALPVTTVVVNIPLIDFTEENGSTEVWPGSHLITDANGSAAGALEERAARLASSRTDMPAGSVVVRDMRMWHRGMPNRSNVPRPMLAMVFNRPFIAHGRTMEIPRAVWDQLSPRTQHILRHNTVTER